MRLGALQSGDTVEVNVRGVAFQARFARVDDLDRAVIEPFSRRITYRRVTARQVVRKVETQQQIALGQVGGGGVKNAERSAFLGTPPVDHRRPGLEPGLLDNTPGAGWPRGGRGVA